MGKSCRLARILSLVTLPPEILCKIREMAGKAGPFSHLQPVFSQEDPLSRPPLPRYAHLPTRLFVEPEFLPIKNRNSKIKNSSLSVAAQELRYSFTPFRAPPITPQLQYSIFSIHLPILPPLVGQRLSNLNFSLEIASALHPDESPVL